LAEKAGTQAGKRLKQHSYGGFRTFMRLDPNSGSVPLLP
jgi:hypothetical protein